jgi:nicotinamide riboside transporter PnuC
MLETLFKFKGTDFIGMVFGIVSTIYLARERRIGFLYGCLCGGGWLAFGVLTESIPSVVANLFLIIFNLRGWFRWKQQNKA